MKPISTVIIPSSSNLDRQISAAMAKFDAARARALAEKEARRDVLVARGLARVARGRIYDAIQRGHA